MERLLNLVLALLASRRFLTKAEITSSIPGYEGTNEAKDRMFERDKDDLRRIGIEIEVGQINPLFEDELGYRIRMEEFSISLDAFTPEESVVASAALALVADLIDSSDSTALFFKIATISDEGDSSLVRLLSHQRVEDLASKRNFRITIEAIRNRRVIEFDYIRDVDGQRSRRFVEPSRMLMRDEEWLIYGWDRHRSAPRYFLLDNISGEVLISSEAFVLRDGIEDVQHVSPSEVIFKARAGLSTRLSVEGGENLSATDTEVVTRFRTHNPDRLMRILLAMDPKIELMEPRSMVAVFEALRERLLDAVR